MKDFFLLIAALLVFTNVMLAQNDDPDSDQDTNESEFAFGADVVSRYIWRGLDLGSDPAVQPYFFWNKGGFSIGTWGSYGFNGGFAEVDLMASYQYKFITIALTDFFFPVENFNYNNRYFNYKSGETTHAIEGSIKLSGPEKFPLGFLAGTVFYGNDLDAQNKNIYSTYLELSYPIQVQNINIETFIGGVINDKPNLYADGAGVINLGFKASKQIKVSDEYSLGAFFSMVINPKYENVHLIFGLNF